MTPPEKVYFPPRPPTSNTMTPAERASLRRSTTKLCRVLGVTLRVLDKDDYDSKNNFHFQRVRAASTTRLPSHSQQSSTRSTVGIRSKESPTSSTFFLGDYHNSKGRQSKTTLLVENGESKFGMMNAPKNLPPLLRVARPRHSQHVFNLSCTSLDSYSSSESADADADNAEQWASTTDASSDNLNSVRLKKMKRLHRILGEELPVNIVFPESRNDDSGTDSDGGHCQSSSWCERPGPSVRTPSYSLPSPVPAKLLADQTPLSVVSPCSSPWHVGYQVTSRRDFDATLSHKVSPHRPPRSALRLSCDKDMRPGSQFKLNSNPLIGNLDLRSLRTISESSKEAEALGRIPDEVEARQEETHIHPREMSVVSPTSATSCSSEWYLSDDETDDTRTEETLVEKKEVPPTVLDATQGVPAMKRVWSHKRKPPPVYEP